MNEHAVNANACCPSCGRPIIGYLPRDDCLVIDLGGLTMRRCGARQRLTRSEVMMLRALHHARGRVVTKLSLMEWIYPVLTDQEWPQIKILDVFVCKIRKKLERLGVGPKQVHLRTVWGVGLAMDLDAASVLIEDVVYDDGPETSAEA